MDSDSPENLYEKSKIKITDEEREKRRKDEKIKYRELRKKGVHQYVVCKITKASIGDIHQFKDNLVLFEKENPFSADIFDDIRFIDPYLIYPNLVRFDLQVDRFSPFGSLGIVDVQLVEKTRGNAVIVLKTSGDLIPLLQEGYALKLYDDAVNYLYKLSDWLQEIYGKAYKQKDSDIHPGKSTKPGYDEAYKKIVVEGRSLDEAYKVWLEEFPEECERLDNPYKSFCDAIRYRRKKLKF